MSIQTLITLTANHYDDLQYHYHQCLMHPTIFFSFYTQVKVEMCVILFVNVCSEALQAVMGLYSYV